MCLGIFVLWGAAMNYLGFGFSLGHRDRSIDFAGCAIAQIRLSIGSERGDCYIDPAREKTL